MKNTMTRITRKSKTHSLSPVRVTVGATHDPGEIMNHLPRTQDDRVQYVTSLLGWQQRTQFSLWCIEQIFPLFQRVYGSDTIAMRVLDRIREFERGETSKEDVRDLYRQAESIPWEPFGSMDGYRASLVRYCILHTCHLPPNPSSCAQVAEWSASAVQADPTTPNTENGFRVSPGGREMQLAQLEYLRELVREGFGEAQVMALDRGYPTLRGDWLEVVEATLIRAKVVHRLEALEYGLRDEWRERGEIALAQAMEATAAWQWLNTDGSCPFKFMLAAARARDEDDKTMIRALRDVKRPASISGAKRSNGANVGAVRGIPSEGFIFKAIVEMDGERSSKIYAYYDPPRGGRVRLGELDISWGNGVGAVTSVSVLRRFARMGVATRMYEVAAQLAAKHGVPLVSDTARYPGAEAFWQKQVSKGRAQFVELSEGQHPNKHPQIKAKVYQLNYPPPETLAGVRPRKAGGHIGSVPVTEVLAIHEALYQQVLQAVPRNDRTNLFPGNQTAILREITDPCLSMERALALVVAGFPKTKSNEVSNSQQPWVAWALLHNPAYPLLLLENPMLRDDIIREYLQSIYSMVEEDARIDGSRSRDWVVLATGVHFFWDAAKTYPASELTSLCNTRARYLMEGLRIINPEEYVEDHRSEYKGREAFLRKMEMPDILPMLFPSQTVVGVASRPRRKKSPRPAKARKATVGGVIGEAKFKQFTLSAYKNPGKNEWTVTAMAPGHVTAGEAQFAGVYDHSIEHARVYNEETYAWEFVNEWDEWGDCIDPQLVGLKGWNLFVAPQFRRQGLATAMYDYARKVFKLPIQKGDFQTPDGAAFLAVKKDTVGAFDNPMLDPRADEKRLRAYAKAHPSDVLMHPNCPPNLFRQLASDLPLEAIQSHTLALFELEDPDFWHDIEMFHAKAWVEQLVTILPKSKRQMLIADCLERALADFEQRHPGNTEFREAIRLRRQYALDRLSPSDWKAACARLKKSETLPYAAISDDEVYTIETYWRMVFMPMVRRMGVSTEEEMRRGAEEYVWIWRRLLYYLQNEVPSVEGVQGSPRRSSVGAMKGKKKVYIPVPTGNGPLFDARGLLRLGDPYAVENRSIPDDFDPSAGKLLEGPRVRWLAPNAGISMKIDASLVQATPANPFYPDRLANYYHAVRNGDILKTPMARVNLVTKSEIEESQERYEDGELARPLNRNDLGKPIAVLTDGNHRAFAAILAGEPWIYVTVDRNYRDDMKKYLE